MSVKLIPVLFLLLILRLSSYVADAQFPLQITSSIRGSAVFLDNLLQPWTSDDGYFGSGSTLRCVTGTMFGTIVPSLYLCERWGKYTYTIPVNNQPGFYQVEFLLSENNISTVQRVFDIQLGQQRTPYLSNLDLVALTGGTFRALKMSTYVYTTGIPIVIRFSSSIDNPKCDSLRIIPATPSSNIIMTDGVIMHNSVSGYCVDLLNGTLISNNWVTMTQCTGGKNQQWLYDTSGFIRSSLNSSWCLTVYQNSSTNQQPIVINRCTESITDPSQVFVYDNTTRYWRVFGRCLDIHQNTMPNPNSATYAPVGISPYPSNVGYFQIWSCGGGSSGDAGQKFTNLLSFPLTTLWKTKNIGTNYPGSFFQESPTSMTIYGAGADFHPPNRIYQGQYVYQQVSGPHRLKFRVGSWTSIPSNTIQKLTISIFPSIDEQSSSRIWALGWLPNYNGGTMQYYGPNEWQTYPTSVTPVEVWMQMEVNATTISFSFSNNGVSIPQVWTTRPNTFTFNKYVISLVAMSHVDGSMWGCSLSNISLQSTSLTSPPLSGVSFEAKVDRSIVVSWNQMTFTTVQISYYLSTLSLANAVHNTSTSNTLTISSTNLEVGKSYRVVVTAIGDGVFYTNVNPPTVMSDLITIGIVPSVLKSKFIPQLNGTIAVTWTEQSDLITTIEYYDLTTPTSIVTTPGTIQYGNTGYCFDLYQGGTYADNLVVLNPCNGSPGQKWTYSVTTQQVISTLTSTCLSIYGNVQSNGQPLVIYPCFANIPTNQKFTYNPQFKQWSSWGKCVDLYQGTLNASKGAVPSYQGGSFSSFVGSGFLQIFTCNSTSNYQQFSPVINPSDTLIKSLTLSRSYVVRLTNYANLYQFSSNASSIVSSDPITPGPIPSIINPSFVISRSFQISASWTSVQYLSMSIFIYDVSQPNKLILASTDAVSPYLLPTNLFNDNRSHVIVLQQSGDGYHHISSVSSFTNSSIFPFQNLISFFPFQYDFQDRVNSQFAVQSSLTNPSFVSNPRGRLLSWSSFKTADQLYYTNSFLPTTFTVCAWVSNDGKNDDTPNMILADRQANQFGIGIWQDGTVFVGTNNLTYLFGVTTTTKTFISQQSYVIPGYIVGQIVHLCVSFNSTNSTSIYINGVLSKTGTLSTFNGSSNLVIGYLSNASWSYLGKMQCLAWWNVVFNSSRVYSLYNSQFYGGCSGIQTSYLVPPPPVSSVQVDTSQFCLVSLNWYKNPSVLMFRVSFVYEGSLLTLNTTQNTFVASKLRSNTIYTFNLYQYGDGIIYGNATSSDVTTITLTTKSGGNCGCYFLDSQQCLTNPLYAPNCHLVDPMISTSQCLPNVSTKLCPSQTTSKSCASKQCMWDPYLNLCFDNLSQPRSIFPCSYWTNYDMTANLACTYHGCRIRNDNLPNLVCTNDTLSSNMDYSTNYDYTSLVNWSKPILINTVLGFGSNINVVQVNLTVPYQLRMNNSIRLPFLTIGQGSMYFKYGGVSNDATRSVKQCGSQSLFSMIQQPIPSTQYFLQAGWTHANLMEYEILTIRSNNSFASNLSDVRSVMLQSIRGSFGVGLNSLVSFISISDDLASLTYTLNIGLDQLFATCSHYGVTFSNISTNHVASYWTIPLSYWEQRPLANTFDYQDMMFYVKLQSIGPSNTIQSIIKQYPFQLTMKFQLKEITSNNHNCSFGSSRMVSTYWVDYSQVDSPELFVGPRLNLTNPSIIPTSNCYGEEILSIEPLTIPCKQYSCITVFQTTTKCRPLFNNGTSFSQCRYASTNDRISDLGGDFNYPTILDAYHAFNLTTFICPIHRTDDFGCQIVPITSSDTVVSQTVSAYPVILSSYPMNLPIMMPQQSVMYGLLPFPTTNYYEAKLLDYANTSSINNIMMDISLHELKHSLVVFVAMKNQALIDKYTISIVTHVNFTIQAYSSGNISDGYLSQTLNFNDIAAYCDHVPRTFTNLCSSCKPLPSCNNKLGCDGISLPLHFLSDLLPSTSNMYQIKFSFHVNPPEPK